jgi:DNA-binding GntR family transcriptional regulator
MGYDVAKGTAPAGEIESVRPGYNMRYNGATPSGTQPAPKSFVIPRQSLTSAVADQLRDRIIRSEIPEGTQLNQGAIAAEFQVSRIPVREALRQLESEGLITIVQHHGAVVSTLSPDDIEELFEIRVLLECEVLKRSIPGLTESDLAHAEAILVEYEKELLRPEHISEWGRLNWEFHSALYSGTRSPHFMSIIRNVNNNAVRYTGLQLYLTREFERAKEEHRKLLELCQARDVIGACYILQQHIKHAGQSLKQILREVRADATTSQRDDSPLPHR